MSEVLVQFAELVTDENGRRYLARACGAQMAGDTRWQGWVEFVPIGGGAPVASSRETTQPNRTDTVYWATGLTPIYLEGALQRALHPLRLTPGAAAAAARVHRAARVMGSSRLCSTGT